MKEEEKLLMAASMRNFHDINNYELKKKIRTRSRRVVD